MIDWFEVEKKAVMTIQTNTAHSSAYVRLPNGKFCSTGVACGWADETGDADTGGLSATVGSSLVSILSKTYGDTGGVETGLAVEASTGPGLTVGVEAMDDIDTSLDTSFSAKRERNRVASIVFR
jgi:hypothetical protein